MEELNKYSILVVDDESSNITALNAILSPEYTVYAAKNGQSAINAAEKHLPDIILLDILMPEMDGYSVIETLKSSSITKKIPVIFITGLSDTDDEEKGLTLGAADYISKPFSPVIVKLRIRNQIMMLDQLRTIERLSMTDQLTELPNRRSFEVRLQAEWGRALREREPISVLMLDADNFKNYNDAYGHQQGDAALKAIAAVFHDVLKRSVDFVARWGGEEFIVLLPNTDSYGAIGVAEKIRGKIEGMEIPSVSGDGVTGLTISIGVNTRVHGRSITTCEFVSGADMALYAAKQKGRNRVCNFEKK
ncbi:MAG: diguanylate cyclase [Oscillospiraceae bacterium]|nr:diguanylate cyclase [Oscillospiraceae bacterium]